MPGHGAPPPAYRPEDVREIFRWTRDKNRRAAVRCGWCSQTRNRCVESEAQHWFLTHACVFAFAHLAKSSPLQPIAPADPAFHLLERQAAADWRELVILSPDIKYYGGHRHGLEPPTPEQLAHAERVDAILVRILGGIPRGHAQRCAPVINLAEYRDAKLRLAA